MESQIWRVQTERIGSLEPFRSERDMEAFLMNNPAIVGCWNPDSDIALPTLVRKQIFTKRDTGGAGRIDLAGISSMGDGSYELRIFELKVGDIDVSAVEQLQSYLEGWENEESAKSEIKKWVLSLKLEEIDNSNVDKIINHIVGVLVGSRFLPEAIQKASSLNIQGIRLARFRAETRSEYFVIVEDQIGTVVQRAKRQSYGWKDFIDAGLIELSDRFVISNKEFELSAKLDQESLGTASKKFIFEIESVSKLLNKEKNIREKAGTNEKKWLDKVIQSIKEEKGISITHATGIVYLAFEWPTSYWVPSQYWIHKRSGKILDQLKLELDR